MNELTWISHGEDDTARLGRALAEVLPPRTVVALVGTLGAGKTRLVQAVAEGAGIDRQEVVSPTFVLLQEYHGRRSIYHLDTYRLRNEEELLQLGLDELIAGGDLVLIEWADRFPHCLPAQHVEVRIEVTGPTERTITVVAHGAPLQAAIGQLAQRLGVGMA